MFNATAATGKYFKDNPVASVVPLWAGRGPEA